MEMWLDNYLWHWNFLLFCLFFLECAWLKMPWDNWINEPSWTTMTCTGFLNWTDVPYSGPQWKWKWTEFNHFFLRNALIFIDFFGNALNEMDLRLNYNGIEMTLNALDPSRTSVPCLHWTAWNIYGMKPEFRLLLIWNAMLESIERNAMNLSGFLSTKCNANDELDHADAIEWIDMDCTEFDFVFGIGVKLLSNGNGNYWHDDIGSMNQRESTWINLDRTSLDGIGVKTSWICSEHPENELDRQWNGTNRCANVMDIVCALNGLDPDTDALEWPM